MTTTSWLPLVTGGVLIGLAASVLVLVNGRIAGISGITGRVLIGDYGRSGWRLLFLLGLVAPAWLPGVMAESGSETDSLRVVIAGLLTGIGVVLGSGCTSGHGVCGLANLSRRSLAATLMFMTTAAVTVYLVRHVISPGGTLP